jgi:hypothetical protein
MMKPAKMRRWGVWGLLLVTLYLAFDVSNQQQGQDVDLSEPVRDASRQKGEAAVTDASHSALSSREWQEKASGDPFRTMQWYVAPKPKAEPPPVPVAPPLPFTYFGKMAEGEQPYAFLQKGKAVQVAKVEDVLENKYRVESITSSAVTFIYLPLNQKQVAVLGAKVAVRAPVVQSEDSGETEDTEDQVGRKKGSTSSLPSNLKADDAGDEQ